MYVCVHACAFEVEGADMPTLEPSPHTHAHTHKYSHAAASRTFLMLPSSHVFYPYLIWSIMVLADSWMLLKCHNSACKPNEDRSWIYQRCAASSADTYSLKIWGLFPLSVGLTFWSLTVFSGLLPGKKFHHTEIATVSSLVCILPDLVGFSFSFLAWWVYFIFFHLIDCEYLSKAPNIYLQYFLVAE